MYTVYAITSKSRKYIYVGLTSDLERRLKQHNNGYEKTTKPYAPFILIYKEIVSTRITEARKEKSIEKRNRKRKLKAMIVESAGLSTDR